MITLNKGIREWPEMLAGDEVLITAILAGRTGWRFADALAVSGYLVPRTAWPPGSPRSRPSGSRR